MRIVEFNEINTRNVFEFKVYNRGILIKGVVCGVQEDKVFVDEAYNENNKANIIIFLIQDIKEIVMLDEIHLKKDYSAIEKIYDDSFIACPPPEEEIDEYEYLEEISGIRVGLVYKLYTTKECITGCVIDICKSNITGHIYLEVDMDYTNQFKYEIISSNLDAIRKFELLDEIPVNKEISKAEASRDILDVFFNGTGELRGF